MPAYFFANQGTSISIVRNQGYLFTTYEDLDGRPSQNIFDLGNMTPGDIVIINVNGLVGLATVTNSTRDYPMTKDFIKANSKNPDSANWKAGMPGIRVDVDLEEFPSPIRYQDFTDEILRAQSEVMHRREPFARDGNASQGTFYRLERPLAETLMRIVGRPLREFKKPELPAVPVSGPYVAQFAPREVRPEQAIFRDRMIKLWGRCPVTGIKTPALLDAAHFKDWRHNNDYEAGMLLNPIIHRAVDREIISITLDADGKKWRVKVAPDAENFLRTYDRLEFPNPLKMSE